MLTWTRKLGLVVALVAASSCTQVTIGRSGAVAGSAAAQSSRASFDEAPCPFPLLSDQDEGEDVTCGYLTVPEFHAEPDGPTMELLVAKFKSTSSEPAEEPLVLLLGGPGQELASILLAFSNTSPITYFPFLDRQDVIVLEQRGIGYSMPSVSCPFDAVGGQEPEVDPTEIDFEDAAAAFGDCAQRLREDGVNLEAYDTKESAADVNDLRSALGYDQVDLMGISFGSKLALTVMRDFPEAVRSAILASPLPLQANIPAGQIIAFDRALKRLFKACDADPGCGQLHPDLAGSFSRAVERLDQDPIPLTVQDPINGKEVDLVIDGDQFIQIVYISTFIGLLLPFVPSMIDAAALGQTAPLEIVAPFSVAYTAGVSLGANYIYNCNDELSFTDPVEVQELVAQADVLPELEDGGFAGTYESFGVCEAIDVEPAAEQENQAVKSDVPAMVVVGEYDPITPPEYGLQAALTLSNSFLVVVPGLGHDPITTGGDCAMSVAVAFLDDPEHEPDLGCEEEMGLEFVG